MSFARRCVGVAPWRDRLDDSKVSRSRPCRTAAVIKGTIFSTIAVMRCDRSGMDGGLGGMDFRSS